MQANGDSGKANDTQCNLEAILRNGMHTHAHIFIYQETKHIKTANECNKIFYFFSLDCQKSKMTLSSLQETMDPLHFHVLFVAISTVLGIIL